MLYCMESLGRSYVEEDETYVLFEKVLIDYLPFANDNTELKVNDLHTKYFLALEELYSMSKSKDANENLQMLKDIVGDEVYNMISNFYYKEIIQLNTENLEVSKGKRGK